MTPSDFPLTFGLIRPQYARSLEKALEAILRYEAEGVILKVELEGIKYAVSNAMQEAWVKTVRERYTYNGKWEALTEAERKLEQSLFHPYPHTIGGYLKKARAATKAAGPMRDDMIAIAAELAPLGERVVGLKAIIGKRKPAPTKTSIAQAERDAKAMTCQCCARKILAETGEIAHHGYQRPGAGWQTASCYGAKALPFEVDRARLGELIAAHRRSKASFEAHLERLKAEKDPLSWTFQDITTKRNAWTKGKTVTKIVTRETFDAVFAETETIRAKAYPDMTYDRLKALKIHETERDIRMLADEIAFQQPRYDGWVQTHERRDGAWVAIAA